MAWVAVLTDPDTAMGFRLAGVETFSAKDGEEVRRLVEVFFERRDPGVVVYNEDFLPFLAEKLQKRIEESLQPVFIPVPHIQSWREGEKGEEYLARLLRRVIGYQIKIKR